MGQYFGLPFLDFIWPPIVAFFAVIALVPLARKWARYFGLTDKPGGRKDHADEVPLVGGLVIFPVFMIVSIFAGIHFASYWPLFVAISLLLGAGALDDQFHINPWIKFFVQFVAAALIVIGGEARLYHLGDLFGTGPLGLGWMSIPFSVVAVVLLINAVNLMDGLDGLAGGFSTVALGWLMIACGVAGHWPPFFTIATMFAAIVGFLFYNMRHPLRERAAIFLGDAGSMTLGLVLAWFCIGLAQDPDPTLVPITIAWILALPIIDACGQFYRRVKEGKHPFYPDRGHFHHHFVHAGIAVGESTFMILVWAFILGGIGYAGIYYGVYPPILTLLWIVLLFSHMALMYKPSRLIRALQGYQGRKDRKRALKEAARSTKPHQG